MSFTFNEIQKRNVKKYNLEGDTDEQGHILITHELQKVPINKYYINE